LHIKKVSAVAVAAVVAAALLFQTGVYHVTRRAIKKAFLFGINITCRVNQRVGKKGKMGMEKGREGEGGRKWGWGPHPRLTVLIIINMDAVTRLRFAGSAVNATTTKLICSYIVTFIFQSTNNSFVLSLI